MATPARNDGKVRALLALLIFVGLALLAIPFFLTPPAFLDVTVRDSLFASDLGGKRAQVTEDVSGSRLGTEIQKTARGFVAPIGRIMSGSGSYRLEVEGYQPAALQVEAAPLQTVHAKADLVPAFGRLEIHTVDAQHMDRPVPASVKRGGAPVSPHPETVVILDLPPGRQVISADAPGFCGGEREVTVEERKVKKVAFPLSADLTGGEIARFILTWGENPSDLDAHFRRLGTSGVANAAHVFYKHMAGVTERGEPFAQLDVDDRNSYGYETVTVYDKASGDYEYYVHHYDGSGTLGGSQAQMTSFTKGCSKHTFSVPPNCAEEIWAVTHLRIKNGAIDFNDQKGCEKGVPLALGGNAPPSPRNFFH